MKGGRKGGGREGIRGEREANLHLTKALTAAAWRVRVPLGKVIGGGKIRQH